MLLRAIRKETEGDTSLAPLRAKTLSCGVSTLWNLHHKIEASRRGRSNAVVPCISLLSVPCAIVCTVHCTDKKISVRLCQEVYCT